MEKLRRWSRLSWAVGVGMALTVSLSILFPSPAEAQLQKILDQPDLGPVDILKRGEEMLENVIAAAADEMDYLRQQIAMDAQIALQTLRQIAEGQQNRWWQGADQEISTMFREIDKSLEEASDRFLALEDFAFIDASILLNRIPLLGKDLPLRKVENASLFHRGSGVYGFRLRGAAFEPTSKVSVVVGGRAIQPGGMDASQARLLGVTVPVAQINDSFQPDAVVMLPVSVTTEKTMPRGWSRYLPWNWNAPDPVERWRYDLHLRLMPQNASTGYRLLGYREVKVAGDPVWTEWGPEVKVRKAGRNCKRHESCAKQKDVCVAIPANAEIVKKGKLPVVDRKKRSCSSWCDWTGHPRITGGKVCQKFKNWRKSKSGKVQLRAQYRPLSDALEPQEIPLKSVADPALSDVETLTFGKLYHAILPKDIASFDLEITLYNGEVLALTRDMKFEGQTGVAELSLENLGANGRRLVVQLKSPGAG